MDLVLLRVFTFIRDQIDVDVLYVHPSGKLLLGVALPNIQGGENEYLRQKIINPLISGSLNAGFLQRFSINSHNEFRREH